MFCFRRLLCCLRRLGNLTMINIVFKMILGGRSQLDLSIAGLPRSSLYVRNRRVAKTSWQGCMISSSGEQLLVAVAGPLSLLSWMPASADRCARPRTPTPAIGPSRFIRTAAETRSRATQYPRRWHASVEFRPRSAVTTPNTLAKWPRHEDASLTDRSS